MTNKHIIDRRLEDRSKLTFNYLSDGEVVRVVTLPFFEHVDVNESKRARYETYNLLSRSSDLYSYLGANSRKLDLTFSMTLPHLIDSVKFVGRKTYIEEINIKPIGFEALKLLFKNPTKLMTGDSTVQQMKRDYFVSEDLKDDVNYIANTEWGQKGITPAEKENLIDRYDAGATLSDLDSIIQATKEGYDDKVTTAEKALKPETPNKDLLLDTITFWINIIRTCLTNNAQSITDGPPLLRLSHGILYQDIPCICTDYSITYDKVAGFDIDTLLPRKIDVSMSLEEFRLGDFGLYELGTSVKRDNLAGWEAVFDKGTIDPGGISK